MPATQTIPILLRACSGYVDPARLEAGGVQALILAGPDRRRRRHEPPRWQHDDRVHLCPRRVHPRRRRLGLCAIRKPSRIENPMRNASRTPPGWRGVGQPRADSRGLARPPSAASFQESLEVTPVCSASPTVPRRQRCWAALPRTQAHGSPRLSTRAAGSLRCHSGQSWAPRRQVHAWSDPHQSLRPSNRRSGLATGATGVPATAATPAPPARPSRIDPRPGAARRVPGDGLEAGPAGPRPAGPRLQPRSSSSLVSARDHTSSFRSGTAAPSGLFRSCGASGPPGD
jgi:hypothetical protein